MASVNQTAGRHSSSNGRSANNRPADKQSTDRRAGVAVQIDPLAVMRIKDLQLRAKAVVEGFYNGLHRSPYHGHSVEFSEYRPYSVGDDLRGLDWKLFARSDRYYIKKFEDETNRRCYLVLDQSQSMGFGSLEYSKIDYARTMVATLAYYLTMQRDSVGLMTFDETIGDFITREIGLVIYVNCLLRSHERSEVKQRTWTGRCARLHR